MGPRDVPDDPVRIAVHAERHGMWISGKFQPTGRAPVIHRPPIIFGLSGDPPPPAEPISPASADPPSTNTQTPSVMDTTSDNVATDDETEDFSDPFSF
jgi:hypothetical protein